MREYRPNQIMLMTMLSLCVASIISFCVYMQSFICKVADEVEKSQEQYEQMISELKENSDDYTFFLDGEIVDIDTVDLNQYEISVSEEAHKVFLIDTTENERNSRTLFWPVFLPW